MSDKQIIKIISISFYWFVLIVGTALITLLFHFVLNIASNAFHWNHFTILQSFFVFLITRLLIFVFRGK